MKELSSTTTVQNVRSVAVGANVGGVNTGGSATWPSSPTGRERATILSGDGYDGKSRAGGGFGVSSSQSSSDLSRVLAPVREDDGTILACLKSTTLFPEAPSSQPIDLQIYQLSEQLVVKIHEVWTNNHDKWLSDFLIRPIYDILLTFTPEKREVFCKAVLQIAEFLRAIQLKNYGEWSFYDLLSVLQTVTLQGQEKLFLDTFKRIVALTLEKKYKGVFSLYDYQRFTESIYLRGKEDQTLFLWYLLSDFDQYIVHNKPWDLDERLNTLMGSFDIDVPLKRARSSE